MAIYRVLLDGIDIYDPTSKGTILIDPVVHTEAGAAGNFEFTMPPMHVFYNNVTPYGSSIEVLEDGNSIFFGRPLKPKIGFYNQKTYHCEGALAFLNDTRPTDDFVYEHTTPTQYFRDLIAYHNSFQSKNERKLIVGNITVNTDLDVYREMTPSMTIMEHIKRGCIGSDGGYLFTRRVNGVTYIDWTKDMPYTCNQTVEFALNLLDMSRSGNDDIYTGVMLKGGERRIKKNGKISNSVVQYGPKWGSAEAIAKYGEILGYQEYPDITDVDDLIAAGAAFLSSQQFESMIFEVSAAERHYLNASLDIFKAGQKVHLVSNPHFVDMMLPVQSVEVRLDSAEKKVILGTQRRQTLTKIQRKTKEEQEIKDKTIEELTDALDIVENNIDDMQVDIGDMQTDISDLIDNQGIIQGDDGNLYQIGVDENGNIYTTKIPSGIRIEQLPEKLNYFVGETYDWTGLVVIAVYGDGTEEDVTNQCTVSPANGSTVEEDGGTHQATVAYTEKALEEYFDYNVVPNVLKKLVVKMSGTANGWTRANAVGNYTGNFSFTFELEKEDGFEITSAIYTGNSTSAATGSGTIIGIVENLNEKLDRLKVTSQYKITSIEGRSGYEVDSNGEIVEEQFNVTLDANVLPNIMQKETRKIYMFNAVTNNRDYGERRGSMVAFGGTIIDSLAGSPKYTLAVNVDLIEAEKPGGE